MIDRNTLISFFPAALMSDPKMAALAQVVADALVGLCKDAEKLCVYPRISELDEGLLDILASDYNAVGYYYDGTVASKRKQIQSLFEVHRHLGTKSAMERALSDLCPQTTISEWFEYGGKPYHFRIVVDITEMTAEIPYNSLLEYAEIFKPVRSVLDNDIEIKTHDDVGIDDSTGSLIQYTLERCSTTFDDSLEGW